MQEHPQYNITPDQGWAKLKPALDEAMPVGRRQRRFGYVWWSTSTLLVCGVVGLGFVKGASALLNPPATNQMEIQQTGKNVTPISIENTPTLTPAGIETEYKPTESSIDHTTKKASSKSNQGDVLPSENKSQQSTPANLLPAIKASKPEPMAFLDNVDEKPVNGASEMETASITFAANDASGKTTELAHEESFVLPTTTTTTTRNVQVVESLPVLMDVAFLSTKNSVESVPTIVIDKSKRNPSFLEPNVAVSGLIGPDGGTGYYGGAGLNVNLSRRFGFTTAIGFMSFGPEASLFGGNKSLDASNSNSSPVIQYDPDYLGNETYLDSKYINNSIGYNVINPLVQRVNQWQLDLGMKWKLSNRFYTDAGVKLGFQTKAYSEYPIISQAELGTANPIVQFDNSLNTYDVIRSNTTSIYAGVGYRFGQHLEVFTNWTHAFDEYLLNEDISSEADLDGGARTDYIRGLSVGLRYTL